MAAQSKFSASKRRPKPATLVLILLLHVLAIYGLAKAFAPGAVGSVERTVLSTFNVTITTPEDVPPEPEPVPDEGAAGEQGKKAVARAETAPKVKIPLQKDKPAPKASSTGTANNSGAKDSGDGTGAAGSGSGTGSGRGGSGMGGGVVATEPTVKSGSLNSATDFPIPEGGRAARIGKSVTVLFTVTPDGRATNCSVARSTADAQTAALVCPLVQRKIRFNPATNRSGDAVAARFGWKQDFFN